MISGQDIEVERARGQIYEFFSALFLNPPTTEMLSGIFNQEGTDAFEHLFPDHPASARLVELAKAYERSAWQVEDFLLDYEALFRVPGEGYVHPYESVYCHEGFSTGKIKGAVLLAEPAREIAHVYRAYGLAPREGFNELPDHLGVELEFMAVLCRKAAEALEGGREGSARQLTSDQGSFLSRHLLRWSSECLNGIREKAGTPFYVCMADLLGAFLEQEQCVICDCKASA
jgi:TorA maturation chaperone TorD